MRWTEKNYRIAQHILIKHKLKEIVPEYTPYVTEEEKEFMKKFRFGLKL